MVKVSVKRYVSRRVEIIREEVKVGVEKLRRKTLRRLHEIFQAAAKVAGGDVKHQRVKGKMIRIGVGQRYKWLQIARYAVEMMDSIKENFDEMRINAQLKELERLLEGIDQGSERPFRGELCREGPQNPPDIDRP